MFARFLKTIRCLILNAYNSYTEYMYIYNKFTFGFNVV